MCTTVCQGTVATHCETNAEVSGQKTEDVTTLLTVQRTSHPSCWAPVWRVFSQFGSMEAGSFLSVITKAGRDSCQLTLSVGKGETWEVLQNRVEVAAVEAALAFLVGIYALKESKNRCFQLSSWWI